MAVLAGELFTAVLNWSVISGALKRFVPSVNRVALSKLLSEVFPALLLVDSGKGTLGDVDANWLPALLPKLDGKALGSVEVLFVVAVFAPCGDCVFDFPKLKISTLEFDVLI